MASGLGASPGEGKDGDQGDQGQGTDRPPHCSGGPGWSSTVTHSDAELPDRPRPNPFDAFVGDAGRTHHGVDAGADEELEVVHHHTWVGEVDYDVGLTVVNSVSRSLA